MGTITHHVLRGRRWWWPLAIVATLVLIYYASLPFVGVHFLKVCHRGSYGPPDACDSWDTLTAAFLRTGYFLDEHNGAVSALASVAVAAFTAVLWLSTDKLWAEARAQRQDARKSGLASAISARAALRSARAAQLTAEAAEVQAKLLGAQADLLEKQHGLARLQYFSEHRPKLKVQDAYLSNDGTAVIYELVNVGGSEATITAGFVAADIVTDQRRFKDTMAGNLDGIENAKIAAGELRLFSRPLTPNLSMLLRFPSVSRLADPADPASQGGHADAIYLFGALVYVDVRGSEFGVERLAVFRRIWSSKRSMFVRTGDPDHEFSY
jgi:hypothetical protein